MLEITLAFMIQFRLKALNLDFGLPYTSTGRALLRISAGRK